jgi:hypothetical protein
MTDSEDSHGGQARSRRANVGIHIQNLAELHRCGLLTDEEFEDRRAAAVQDL